MESEAFNKKNVPLPSNVIKAVPLTQQAKPAYKVPQSDEEDEFDKEFDLIVKKQ